MSWTYAAWSGRRALTPIGRLLVIASICMLLAFWRSAPQAVAGSSLGAPSAACGAEVPAKSNGSRVTIAVWDTARPSEEPLTPSALAEKNGWISIPLHKTVMFFQGDAILSNGRILLVARKGGTAVEVYAVGFAGPVARARLRLQAPSGEPASTLDHMSLAENATGAACLEVFYKTVKGAGLTAKFRIKKGDV